MLRPLIRSEIVECIGRAIEKCHAELRLAQAFIAKVVNDDGLENDCERCPAALYVALHVVYDTGIIPVHVLWK